MSRIARFGVRMYAAARRVLPLEREPLRSLYSRAYFAYKRLEDPFAWLLRARPELLRGGHVVDAGANIGYTTLLFARHVEPPFAVHAFEPDPPTAKTLARNVLRSPHAPRVVVHAEALGARRGTARLWHNEEHPADHRIVQDGGTFDVPMTTIDDALGDEPVAFVKMDVQGYEPEVVRGMAHVLARNPKIAVAFEYMGDAALLAFFRGRGFALQLLTRGGLAPLGDLALKKDEYVNVLALR